jgi:Tol biopolymer transport system component
VDESGAVISHTEPSLYQHVILVDVDGRQAVDISAGVEVDEGRPAWHPSGNFLAVPRSATGAGKQLYLVSPDGSQLSQLTDDPFHNHSALTWSPDGRVLAFMRLPRMDGSDNPTVMQFDMESGEISPVAEGAFLPGWWP